MIAAGRRDVRVERGRGAGRGDPRRLRRTPHGARAGGRGRAGGGEAVRELLGELLRQEAVVDCTQAYRLAHRHGSLGSPFFPALDDGRPARAGSGALPSPRRPPAKRSSWRPRRPRSGTWPLAGGRPRRRGPAPVTFEELSSLLAVAYGGGRRSRRPVRVGGCPLPASASRVGARRRRPADGGPVVVRPGGRACAPCRAPRPRQASCSSLTHSATGCWSAATPFSSSPPISLG